MFPADLPNPAVPREDADEAYADALQHLADMGISDLDRGLEALKACHGDVDDAVSWLIENGMFNA
jgi:hypothetical protein